MNKVFDWCTNGGSGPVEPSLTSDVFSEAREMVMAQVDKPIKAIFVSDMLEKDYTLENEQHKWVVCREASWKQISSFFEINKAIPNPFSGIPVYRDAALLIQVLCRTEEAGMTGFDSETMMPVVDIQPRNDDGSIKEIGLLDRIRLPASPQRISNYEKDQADRQ